METIEENMLTDVPNLLDGTEEFLTAADHPIPDVPAIPAAEDIALRLKLLLEEFDEELVAVGFDGIRDYVTCLEDGEDLDVIQESIDAGKVDLVEMVDAFHDITVIAYGGALETAGSAAAKATAAEVTRSNLAKIVDGKVLRRDDGKIQKPPGFQPPDIAGVLEAHGWKQ